MNPSAILTRREYEVMKPNKSCPLCSKKHYTKDQVIACMELDLREDKVKNRKLIKI